MSKYSRHQYGLLLAEQYCIPKIGVVVPRGTCPTNEGSCPIGVIVLWGNCPLGSCPQGSCPRGNCSRILATI